ncbi:hypothetical protein AMAG_08952 [Allomyces macrogynus ATCC 38327]|uniref:Rho-GAP domain-containing protein n=1 Tax=Allomyces macrogynus (strain ATCC 38327) TaxID=578462 RepID=A0A0L0SMW2_ALLM3|nr:hypothetical protein AMAG_08952 [Allomyces macrogynus ATCC 38327]|eukprot:KNE63891.1 hypothetical protein AMAG_08952 [Allomyces macrogynus ATCC 38327]
MTIQLDNLGPDELRKMTDHLWRLVDRQRHIIFQLREEIVRLQAANEQVPDAAPAASGDAIEPEHEVDEASPQHMAPLGGPVLPPRTTSTATTPLTAPTLPSRQMTVERSPVDRALPPVQRSPMPSPLLGPAVVPAAPVLANSLPRASLNIPAPSSSAAAAIAPVQTTPPTVTQLAHLRTSLHKLMVPVLGTFLRAPKPRAKDVLHLVVSVRISDAVPPTPSAPFTQLWCVAKTHADLTAFETKIKAAAKSGQYKDLAAVRLPDKNGFAVGRNGTVDPTVVATTVTSTEQFLAQVAAAVVEYPFGPLTQQLVDFVATDLNDPATSLAPAQDESQVPGSGLLAPVADATATSTAPSPVQSPTTLPVHHESGISRLFKKATHYPLSRHAMARNAATAPNPRGNSTDSRARAQPVFGVPLDRAIAAGRVKDGYEMPAVVYRCIEFLDAHDARNEEGIYRLSGSSATIRALKDRFNAEGDVDLMSEDDLDVHAVSGLLKLWFRELPESILSEQYHPLFAALQDTADVNDRIGKLAALINRLPLPNYTVLRALIAHLASIVANADVNKMTIRNIGIVFAPTLGIPAGIFALMILKFDEAFDVAGGQKTPEEVSLRSEEQQPAAAAALAAPAAAGVSRSDSATSDVGLEEPDSEQMRKAARRRNRTTIMGPSRGQLYASFDGMNGAAAGSGYGESSASLPTMPDQQHIASAPATMSHLAEAANASPLRIQTLGISARSSEDSHSGHGEDDVASQDIDDGIASAVGVVATPTVATHAESSQFATQGSESAPSPLLAATHTMFPRTASLQRGMPLSRTASLPRHGGRSASSRNSLVYAEAAPPAMLDIERALTPVDVHELAAIEEVSVVASSSNLEESGSVLDIADAPISPEYLDYYAPTAEAVDYMIYAETSDLVPPVSAAPTRSTSGATIATAPDASTPPPLTSAAAPPRGQSRSVARHSMMAHFGQLALSPPQEPMPAVRPRHQVEADLERLLASSDRAALSNAIAAMDPSQRAALQAVLDARTATLGRGSS